MKYCVGIFIISVIAIYISILCFDLLGKKWSIFIDHSIYFTGAEKITTVFASISLFLIFLKINIRNNRIINSIASTTFGVYLIHDNNLMRSFLWQTLFKNNTYSESCILIIYSIGVFFIVFTVCVIVDLIRKNTIEKIAMKIIDKSKEFNDNIYLDK